MIITVPPMRTPGILPLVRPFSRPIISDKSLVAYYVFDREGKLMDLSGYGNHGTIAGATWTAKGRYGTGLEFDGIDNEVNLGTAPVLNFTSEDFTIACRMSCITTSATGIILSRAFTTLDGYSFKIKPGGTLQFLTYQSTPAFQSTVSVTDLGVNTWRHVVIIRAGAVVTIYLDGVDDTGVSDAHIDPTGNVNRVAHIGKHLWGGGDFINVRMDSMIILKKALTAMEVKDLYESGL